MIKVSMVGCIIQGLQNDGRLAKTCILQKVATDEQQVSVAGVETNELASWQRRE
jgi:hypothetical protein